MTILVLLIVASLELGYILVIQADRARERADRERWMDLALEATADMRRANFLMAELERDTERLEAEAKRLVSALEDQARV